MKEKEIQELKKELQNMKSVLLIEMPFFASLLRKCRVVLDEKIEAAGVNEKEMRINPEFFRRLSPKTKMFVYCHEAAHLAFGHLERGKNKNQKLFNDAADCCINKILMDCGFKNKVEFPLEIILPEALSKVLSKKEEDIAKMSVEEIYYLMEKSSKKIPAFNSLKDLILGDKTGTSGSAKSAPRRQNQDKRKKEIILQEGDPKINQSQSSEEIEKYWQEIVAQAVVQAKIAGKLLAELERLVSELLKPRVRWKDFIKKEIINGLGKTVVSDWKKSSRRYKSLPGAKRLTLPNVWFLIDTSGSISENELKQFLSEVYSILKNQARGIIIPWDAKVYPLIKLRKPADLVLQLNKMLGGESTVILPALKEVLKLMKLGDLVIVLTDGEIWDRNENETQELFKKVGQKSNTAIFATIFNQIDLPLKWKKVKIELKNEG